MTLIDNASTLSKIVNGDGFIAALDQSGGSTPAALSLYGIPPRAYTDDTKMFQLIHEMRVRIMSSGAFNGTRVIAAILFEATMNGSVEGIAVPKFLLRRDVIPFLKIDRGLQAEENGVSLLKPIPQLKTLLARAARLGVFGTKMRSTIRLASAIGIAAAVEQQFRIADQIVAHGLMPIIELEVLVTSPENAEAELILRREIFLQLTRLSDRVRLMLKLTLPTEPDFYLDITRHEQVTKLIALSGGYGRAEACRLLAANHGIIASFSRALTEGLQHHMSNMEFDAKLNHSIAEIYQASTQKVRPSLLYSSHPVPHGQNTGT